MEEHPAPQEPAPPPSGSGVTFQRPVVVAMLYLLNFFTGFSAIAGVVLAYIWRKDGEAQAWEQGHYTYLIRTFWVGFAVFVLTFFGYFATFFAMVASEMRSGGGGPPTPMFFFVVFAAFGLWFLAGAWFCVRCVMSLAKASSRREMRNPRTWLF